MTIIQPISTRESVRKSKLYLVPTPDKEFGDEWLHPKFSPIPSPLTDLPEVNKWSENFVIKVEYSEFLSIFEIFSFVLGCKIAILSIKFLNSLTFPFQL